MKFIKLMAIKIYNNYADILLCAKLIYGHK